MTDPLQKRGRDALGVPPEVLADLEKLAGLRLDPAERRELAGQLLRILDYVAQLRGVDTEGVPPCAHAVEVVCPRRQDDPGPSLPRAEALGAAPDRDGEFFLAPPLVPGTESGTGSEPGGAR